MTFFLHPRLAAGGALVTDLAIRRVLLKDDSRWPWLVLVPRRPDLSELHQLTEADARTLMGEVRRASAAVASLDGVAKVNVGALGNEVPQLHIHILGRWPGDDAWPGPVWGVSGKIAYSPEAQRKRVEMLRAALGA